MYKNCFRDKEKQTVSCFYVENWIRTFLVNFHHLVHQYLFELVKKKVQGNV